MKVWGRRMRLETQMENDCEVVLPIDGRPSEVYSWSSKCYAVVKGGAGPKHVLCLCSISS